MPIHTARNANHFDFPQNSFHEVPLTVGSTVKMTAEIDKPNVFFYFVSSSDNFASDLQIMVHNFNTEGDLNWVVPTGYSKGYVYAQMVFSTDGSTGNNYNYTVGANDGKDFAEKQGASLSYSLRRNVKESSNLYAGPIYSIPATATAGHLLGIYPQGTDLGLSLRIKPETGNPQKGLIEENVLVNIMAGCDGSTLSQFAFDQPNVFRQNLNKCGQNSNLNLMAFIQPTVNGNEIDFEIGDPERNGKVRIISV